MANHEYRRSLVMMRALEPGYAGHARLERRTLTGTMQMTAGGTGALRACFVGRRGDALRGVELGTLSRDRSGQTGLYATFDPRNIGGMDLNEVRLLLVVRVEDGAIVLSGYVNGSFPVDWEQVRQCVAALWGGMRPSPNAEDAGQIPETAAEPQQAEMTERDLPDEPGFVPEQTTEAAAPETMAPETTGQTAAVFLQVDMTEPWPEPIDSLRILFLTQTPFVPFEEPGYIFVRAALPPETGMPHCAVGLQSEDGRIRRVCYALPAGSGQTEPPAGLEGYERREGANGTWWATYLEVE